MINMIYLNFILFLIISFIVMKITFKILDKFNFKDRDIFLNLKRDTDPVTALGISFIYLSFKFFLPLLHI